jgi:hypothetical protein
MISDMSVAVMLMPVPVVALSAFEVRGAVGTEAGRVVVRREFRVCAGAVNGSTAASVVRTIFLKSKVTTLLPLFLNDTN